MEGFMVDGIIICLCSYKRNKEEYSRLQQAGMPMVFYDRIPYGLEVPQVIVDDYMKSFFLVESLIRSGRKQIVHIQEIGRYLQLHRTCQRIQRRFG